MNWRHGARAAALLGAAGLHLLALWVWSGALQPKAPAATPVRVSLRWLTPPPRPPTPPQQATAPTAEPARPQRPNRPLSALARPLERTSAPASATPGPVEAQPIAEPAVAAAPANPTSAPSLLDGEATRRAVHSAAHERSLARRSADRVGNEPVSASEQLAGAVQRSAKGDCVKGEYFGAGMGLLSVPFLAAAALRDRCSR